MLAQIKPLTQEERQLAHAAAEEAVMRDIGERPQRDEPKAEVVRAALCAYLDEQEDLISSRKHFTKMFQRRVDYLERLTVISLWINVQIIHMLYERVKKEPYDLTELLEDAIGAGIATESAIHLVVEQALQQKTKPPAE